MPKVSYILPSFCKQIIAFPFFTESCAGDVSAEVKNSDKRLQQYIQHGSDSFLIYSEHKESSFCFQLNLELKNILDTSGLGIKNDLND